MFHSFQVFHQIIIISLKVRAMNCVNITSNFKWDSWAMKCSEEIAIEGSKAEQSRCVVIIITSLFYKFTRKGLILGGSYTIAKPIFRYCIYSISLSTTKINTWLYKGEIFALLSTILHFWVYQFLGMKTRRFRV